MIERAREIASLRSRLQQSQERWGTSFIAPHLWQVGMSILQLSNRLAYAGTYPQESSRTSDRRWGALEAECESLREQLRSQQEAARRAAERSRHELDLSQQRVLAAAEETKALTAKLAQAASEHAQGSRAKCAEIIVERLRTTQQRVEELEKQQAQAPWSS